MSAQVQQLALREAASPEGAASPVRRRRHLPTVSKLGLAQRCAYPWTSGLAWPELPASPAAAYGSAVHLVAEAIGQRLEGLDLAALVDRTATELALGEADRVRLRADAEAVRAQLVADRERWPGARWWAEVPVAYCARTDTARRLPSDGRRDYSDATDTEVCGTIDLMIADGDTLAIRDWKTGRYRLGHDPARDPQLRAYALAAARLHRRDRVAIEYGLVLDGEVRLARAELDSLELASVALELVDVVLRSTAAGMPQPVPGAWCAGEWCPIVADCPRTQAALVEVVAPLTAIVDDAHASSLLDRVEACEAALEQVRAALRAWAAARPISRPDGRRYGAVEKSRRAIDVTPSALAILEAAGAAGAIEHSVTMAAIRRALKSTHDGTASRVEREVMAALEAAGAVRESRFTTYTER